MFETAISRLNDILKKHLWAGELAGILPLSAFIDFIDLSKIHLFQLTGGALPLWSWPVTLTGGRLLLSDEYKQKDCCLDRYGRTPPLMVMDGCYGEQYALNNPETVRMCISSQGVNTIQNNHDNMSQSALRIQKLEIIHISRMHREVEFRSLQSWPRRILLEPWLTLPYRHLVVSTTGWIMLLGMITMSGILRCFLSLAFLVVIVVTGVVIFYLYGSRPRMPPVAGVSTYNRLCVVTDPMNAMDCTVFYGGSTVINSLLNQPMEPLQPHVSRSASAPLRMLLRILILGQWGLVIGASALKDWDAYFITFWIAFCIFSHTYLFSTHIFVNSWMKSYGNIKLERYQTELSSRRALLNTIIALNPDPFPWEGARKWVDGVVAPGPSRERWEKTTQTVMDKAFQEYSTEILASPAWAVDKAEALGEDWNNAFPFNVADYWRPCIFEGIHMAAKIKKEMILSGQQVSAYLGIVE